MRLYLADACRIALSSDSIWREWHVWPAWLARSCAGFFLLGVFSRIRSCARSLLEVLLESSRDQRSRARNLREVPFGIVLKSRSESSWSCVQNPVRSLAWRCVQNLFGVLGGMLLGLWRGVLGWRL